MLLRLGAIDTTLSFAVPVAAVVVLVVLLAGFEEHGPQSQGLGVLVVGAVAACAILAVNAGIAGLLSWRARGVRPRFTRVAVLAVVLAVPSVLVLSLLR